MTVDAKKANLTRVEARIAGAKKRYGREDEITLIAVSKKFPAADILDFYALGLVNFGENYIQEWLKKREVIKEPVIWHMIGNIQSNKTRPVAEFADWAHTVDRPSIARRLNDARPPHLAPLNVCIEVNISGKAEKHGISVSEIDALAAAIMPLPRLKLRGLMCVPTAAPTAKTEAEMARAYDAFVALKKWGPSVDTLSMGMSADLELAIKYGATAIRVGSALFGERVK